jgi:7-cyano-7-deazaguanine synthase
MSKADIAREARGSGWTRAQPQLLRSRADGGACGLCDACRLRAKGFEEAGLPDPTRYAAP